MELFLLQIILNNKLQNRSENAKTNLKQLKNSHNKLTFVK